MTDTVDADHVLDALADLCPAERIITWVAVVSVADVHGAYRSFVLRPTCDPIDFHRGLLDAGLHNIRNRKG